MVNRRRKLEQQARGALLPADLTIRSVLEGIGQLGPGWVADDAAESKTVAKATALLRLFDVGVVEFERHVTLHPPAPLTIFALVYLARHATMSDSQSSRASMKNGAARRWVLSQWALRRAEFKSKAAFAEEYADKVAKRFKNAQHEPLVVSPTQIARDWLPKG